MIRVGVVGFGLAGRVFHAPLIASVDGLELAAVVERSGGEAARRYPGIVTYRSFEALLADDSLNLLVIASPSGLHYEMARQALMAGKNVVVDKPVATGSAQIAELMALAKKHNTMLVPFHNRRWDADFLTVQKLMREGVFGRLVAMESRMDRWNPGVTRKPWKDRPEEGGGILLDLGTHLVYLALVLFGKPLGVGAEVLREKDGEGANDSFTVRLRYERMYVTLGANALSSPPGPRFVLRGTKGNFRKKGLDPQEAALGKVTRIEDPQWGSEPASQWGMLHVDIDGGMVTRPVESVPGDYRRFYTGIRDALLGKSAPPVEAVEAWRTARILEWAEESAASRCEAACDWSNEPR